MLTIFTIVVCVVSYLMNISAFLTYFSYVLAFTILKAYLSKKLKDAPIVIFDEATANIDPENEDKLKSAIEELTKNKTIIMIAHRLSTIRNADQILVLNNGKIEQRGNHEELMKQGGLYKTLISMKNKTTIWKIAN